MPVEPFALMPVDSLTPWHWWSLGGALILVNLFAPGNVFLWVGAAAWLVGMCLLAWPSLPLAAQLLVFAGLALASLFAWWRYLVARTQEDAEPRVQNSMEEADPGGAALFDH